MKKSSKRWLKGMTLGLAMLISAPLAQGGSSAPTPLGVWEAFDDKTGKVESHVKIYRYGKGLLAGRIIRLIRDPKAICEGCTGKEKGRSRKGLVIMWAMEKDDDHWEGGRIFDPKTGKDYRCKIWLEGHNELKVRGYLGPIYRTQTWKRKL